MNRKALVMKYRKKPVVVEASQWFPNSGYSEGIVQKYRILGRDSEVCKICGREMREHGWIDTLESGHIVCPGDFVITGVKGERYPCKPDIFTATYEPIDESLE